MAERVESSSDMVANTPDSKARSRCPGSETTDGDLPQQDQQEQQRSRRGTSSSINQQEPQRERSDVAAAEPPSERQVVPPEQFSVFTVNEKKAIILTGSLAGFFSPLSSSIYFPDLNTIAAALHVSASQINLTVTTYLIFQGIAPMMIAGFSDGMGRRPAYMLCFIVYIAANLGLALQNSYAALLLLRMLQSAGSSGTIALANGLVGDTVTSAERGTYIAFASLGSILGPTLAPITGGLIGQYLDWHWIFWVLLIASVSFFIPLLLFLPETCRKVVGDGSIPPPRLNWSLTDVIRHRRRQKKGIAVDKEKIAEFRKHYKFRVPNPLATLNIVFDIESGLILGATGLALACFYAISTGASSALHDVYGFNDIQIALVFIPIGAGGIVSAFTTGKLVDWNFHRHARRHGMLIRKNVRQDLSNFPIEQARMEVALPLFYLGLVCIIAYGWTMSVKVSLAAPVIFLFIIGYALIAAFQVFNVLMVDIYPGRPAAASAANNLIRCELGAAASAAIEPMSKAMGRGWAYTTLALIAAVFAPTLIFIMRHGITLRKKKAAREARRIAQKAKEERKSWRSRAFVKRFF